jgi:hypothetical protein
MISDVIGGLLARLIRRARYLSARYLRLAQLRNSTTETQFRASEVLCSVSDT